MPFCSQCGGEIPATAKFCSSCGSTVDASSTQISASITLQVPKVSPQKRKIFTWVISGVIGLLLVYLYATPYLVASQFKSAIDTKNYRELSKLIDFDALRISLKGTLQGGLQKVADEQAEVFPDTKGAGSMVADFISNGAIQAIDKIVTPESLMNLKSGAKGLGEIMDKSKANPDMDILLKKVAETISISTGYKDLNHFDIRFSAPHAGTAKITLTRQGLAGWKLTDVDIAEVLPYVFRKAGLTKNENEIFQLAEKRQDYSTALKWAKISADQDDAQGLLNLALLYENGLGVKQRDLSEAVKLYRKAADGGSAFAYRALGELYWYGTDGVTSNLAEAKKWADKLKTSGISLTGRDEVYLQDVDSAVESGDGFEYTPVWLQYVSEKQVQPGYGIGELQLGQSISTVKQLLGTTHAVLGFGFTNLEDGELNFIETIDSIHLSKTVYFYRGEQLTVFSTLLEKIALIELNSYDVQTLNRDKMLLNILIPLGKPVKDAIALWGKPTLIRKGGGTHSCAYKERERFSMGYRGETGYSKPTEYHFPGVIVLACDSDSIIYDIFIVPSS